MILAVDFDGTLVRPVPFDAIDVPLELLTGAREALEAFKRAGHVVLVYSSRANASLRLDGMLDPLVRAGVVPFDEATWEEEQPLHQARFEQMVDFCSKELLGLVDAVDDGVQGKPVADLFIDNRAVRFDGDPDSDWTGLAARYGEPPSG